MPQQPTGTVTFLFTDIEGSTTRWEHQTQVMQVVLARHDAILHSIIEAHGGTVFKTVGDAFYAVFASAPDAVHAALAAQRALQVEPRHAAIGELRVRIALHTGTPEVRGDDYFGPALNRVARLLSAGHGGQILLSMATQELVRDHLPPDVQLRELGEYRLRDLSRPERIFQVIAHGLPTDFPALRTLDNRPNNLPIQRDPLIGREREVAEIVDLLRRPEVGLVTLTGPGGTGKTRLSLQAAADLLNDFKDGAWFVELAPIHDPALVSSTIAQVLGLSEDGGPSLQKSLQHYLRDRQVLLVLDNFEQIVPAAPLVTDLLAVAPALKVLVTSREVLHTFGEHEYPVPPLALPVPKRPPVLEQLTQYAAVSLFIQRAQAVRPDFQVTSENAPAVAEICVALDGLPLAIELAAARVKLFAPQALLARLDNRLKLLTGGARERTARQQTLQGALDWSYSLLEPEEQHLFAQLGVFVGGWTLEAAEAVCNAAGELSLDPLDGLQSLADKSLVRQIETGGGEPHFTMLETIREYAHAQLDASGEAEALRRQHAEYYLTLAESAQPELRRPEQAMWLKLLETSHENLRAALQWLLERQEFEAAARLAGALAIYWDIHGHLSEGRQWLDAVLGHAELVSQAVRAKVLSEAGYLALRQNDYAQADPLCTESLRLYRELGDDFGSALVLNTLGVAAWQRGHYQEAQELIEQALAVFNARSDSDWIAAALFNLGLTRLFQGDPVQAATYLQESEQLYSKLRNVRQGAMSRTALGWAVLLQGQADQAAVLLTKSLSMHRSVGDRVFIMYCLVGLAGVSAAVGQPVRATRLLGAAEALRNELQVPVFLGEQSVQEIVLGGIRQQLDEEAFSLAFREGQAMMADKVITYALEETP